MKKFSLALVSLFFVGSVSAAEYTIDPTHTFPNFTISHLGFSTMHGTFTGTKGKLMMDQSAGTGSVDITIDASSVFTGFGKRDDHLRSPDFFNVVEFPNITFKSTSVKFNGMSSAKVMGDLTIMGVSKPVTLDVDKITCGKHPFNPKINEVCGFNATTSIKRSEFGVKYGLPAIGDDVMIMLEVEATR